ncbi:MAG: hypothetical protein VX044_02790 [Planctomycetota bacterium]|nr:hypothetical protein [Planctomycetota bacterium]
MRARKTSALLSTLALAACAVPNAGWPQAAGPRGDWTAIGAAPPRSFSVTTGENIRWRETLGARAVNSRGDEVTGDPRSRWDGWDWVFNGSPSRINDHLYYTLATGTVYAIDTRRAAVAALIALSDLGPAGETWTANSVSYAGGRLFHRTARELLCIGEP